MKFAIGALMVYGAIGTAIALAIRVFGGWNVAFGMATSAIFTALIVGGIYLMIEDN